MPEIPAPPYTSISPKQAQHMVEQNEAVVIDVRQPGEWQTGHIEQAKLIPINSIYQFGTDLQAHAISSEQAIVFVCASGNRSSSASEIACLLGFTNVYNLEGGMHAWQTHTLPIVK